MKKEDNAWLCMYKHKCKENSLTVYGAGTDRVWGKQYMGWGQRQSMGKTVHGAGTETEYGENSTWGGDTQSMG